ncbi:MAG TPA: M14 family zinc carboxypeptidase [Gemmataceae bacterium]|nr:M14 family zinc carboxypeptidase [Gemmataceae bacterium]
MNARLLAVLACLVCLSPVRGGEGRADPKAPDWLLPVPELQRDPKIPTMKQVVGHAWGEDVSSYSEIERYLRALVAAAPTRARLEVYGKTYEGRPLHLLILSSPENLKALDELRKDNLRLADPRRTTPEEADALAARAPAVVWLAYCVHGDETSPSDAALLTAYHLLADRRPETRALLEKLVVVIDPLQNPDGRERFVNFHRERRGAFVESEPLAADRAQRWPGGRFNHYLFDMNRDWYLQTQGESKARVAAYLGWQPQIFIDAHEMGANENFFFDPPAEPVSPFLLPRQREWYLRVGKNHARRFDQYGFAYTTREMFDGFGPQYGSTYPALHGAISFLWEQGGVRGKVVERNDDTKLHYHDAVRHHYISALATLETAAANRAALLRDFYQIRADSIALGRNGPVRDYFLLEGDRPGRAAMLAALLLRNGIEVRRVSKTLKATTTDIVEGKKAERTIPPGSYHVPLAQPASRVARSLLDRHMDLGEEFIKRQLKRQARGQEDKIYDITTCSLPLAHGVACLATHNAVEVPAEEIRAHEAAGEVSGGRAKVAYLVGADDDGVPRALCDWLRAGLRVYVADQPLKVGGVAYRRGSLILKVHGNPETVHAAAEEAAKKHGLKIHATDTGFVDEGASLGGPNVTWVKPPRILLVVDRPVSYTVGHTWYLFDQVWHYPVTRIAARNLGSVDLRKYNVLILPDGKYTGAGGLGEGIVTRLKDWVQQGGTLVLVKGAAAWAAGDKVKLLATKLERRPSRPEEAKAEKDEKKESKSADEPPYRVPGAFLRATADDDHWLTFGVKPETSVLFNGNVILTPLKLKDGRNLVSFGAEKQLLVSGYCWPDTLKLIAGKPYLVHQALGKGHVIGFADDPNFRAMCPETQRLFLNAVLLGPGH